MTDILAHNLPKTLESGSLTLRRLALSDAPAFAKMMQAPENARMSRNIARHMPLLSAEFCIMDMQARERRGCAVSYALTQTGQDALLGYISLFRETADAMTEIDYQLNQPLCHDAYGEAACRLILSAAKTHLGVKRMKASVFVDNRPVLYLFEKIGFSISGPAVPSFSMFRMERVAALNLSIDLACPALNAASLSARHKPALYNVS